MSLSPATPFFHPELLIDLGKFPKTSAKWNACVDQISNDIKLAEEFLRGQFSEIERFEISVEGSIFLLTFFSGSNQKRLCYKMNLESNLKPVIELPLKERVEAYQKFPLLFNQVQSSLYVQTADSKAKNLNQKSLLEITQEIFERVKVGALASPKLENLLQDLKQLRTDAPKNDSDIKTKAQWFKNLANTLLQSEIFKQVFDQVKIQIPEIWSQLTFKQKLKFGALAPIVGAGAYIGGIGLAGGGSAVGVPVVIVILLLLLLNNSLIDFLDYVIKQLSVVIRNEPSPDAVSKLFEEILNAGLKTVFGKNHDSSNATRIDGEFSNPFTPRDYELYAVAELAKKYNGTGYVTQYSADGGIDGYIVCEATKEVLLVQAKLYNCKVGFPEVTQYLGTFFYWKKSLEKNFPYPISKMVLACTTDYSIEAKKVADAFSDFISLEKIKTNI